MFISIRLLKQSVSLKESEFLHVVQFMFDKLRKIRKSVKKYKRFILLIRDNKVNIELTIIELII